MHHGVNREIERDIWTTRASINIKEYLYTKLPQTWKGKRLPHLTLSYHFKPPNTMAYVSRDLYTANILLVWQQREEPIKLDSLQNKSKLEGKRISTSLEKHHAPRAKLYWILLWILFGLLLFYILQFLVPTNVV